MTFVLLLAQASLNLTCTVDVVKREAHCVEAKPCAPCATPTPTPNPTPTPTPGVPPIGPDGNYPIPADGVCPAWFANSLSRVGVAFRSRVPVKPQGGKYLGWRYNFDQTPQSRPPYCPHASGRLQCEQWKPCQVAGPFFMSLPGHFKDEPCDPFSGDSFWCHHKPEGPNGESGKGAQTGPTTVCAVPKGAAPNDPRGSCVTVNVQP